MSKLNKKDYKVMPKRNTKSSIRSKDDFTFSGHKRYSKHKPKKVQKLSPFPEPGKDVVDHKTEIVNNMRSKIRMISSELSNIRDENGMLRKFKVKNEQELIKISTSRGTAPVIARSHDDEVRRLRAILRETQTDGKESDSTLKSLDIEIKMFKGEIDKRCSITDRKKLKQNGQSLKDVTRLENEVARKKEKAEDNNLLIEKIKRDHEDLMEVIRNDRKDKETRLAELNHVIDDLQQTLMDKLKQITDFDFAHPVEKDGFNSSDGEMEHEGGEEASFEDFALNFVHTPEDEMKTFLSIYEDQEDDPPTDFRSYSAAKYGLPILSIPKTKQKFNSEVHEGKPNYRHLIPKLEDNYAPPETTIMPEDNRIPKSFTPRRNLSEPARTEYSKCTPRKFNSDIIGTPTSQKQLSLRQSLPQLNDEESTSSMNGLREISVDDRLTCDETYTVSYGSADEYSYK